MNPLFFDVPLFWWFVKAASFCLLVAGSIALIRHIFYRSSDSDKWEWTIALNVVGGVVIAFAAGSVYFCGWYDQNQAESLTTLLHKGGVVRSVARDSDSPVTLNLIIMYPQQVSVLGEQSIHIPDDQISIEEANLRKISNPASNFPLSDQQAVSSVISTSPGV